MFLAKSVKHYVRRSKLRRGTVRLSASKKHSASKQFKRSFRVYQNIRKPSNDTIRAVCQSTDLTLLTFFTFVRSRHPSICGQSIRDESNPSNSSNDDGSGCSLSKRGFDVFDPVFGKVTLLKRTFGQRQVNIRSKTGPHRVAGVSRNKNWQLIVFWHCSFQ